MSGGGQRVRFWKSTFQGGTVTDSNIVWNTTMEMGGWGVREEEILRGKEVSGSEVMVFIYIWMRKLSLQQYCITKHLTTQWLHHHWALSIMALVHRPADQQLANLGWLQPASVLGFVQVGRKYICSGIQAEGSLVTWGVFISRRSSQQEPNQTLSAFSPQNYIGPGRLYGAKLTTKSSGTRVNTCWRIIQTIAT